MDTVGRTAHRPELPMPSFHRRTPDEPTARHPWEVAHAAPEDVALGVELELIEAVRQRSELTADGGPEADRLDAEIDQLLGTLDGVAGEVSPFLGEVA